LYIEILITKNYLNKLLNKKTTATNGDNNVNYISQMQTLGIIVPDRYNDKTPTDHHEPTITKPTPPQPDNPEQLTLSQSTFITKLTEALTYQAQQFERFKELTEKKFTTLSKDLLELTMQLKEARQHINKLKEKLEVTQAREALINYQQGDKPPLDKPIDRNGVAPKDVQIHDIFNFSGKRF